MNKSQKIRLYYGIFLTVLAAVVGVAFIIAVSQVYYGGIAENPDYPFEIERIREHILVPFALLLFFAVATIGGIVLWAVFPVVTKRKVDKNNGHILKRMKMRMPTAGTSYYRRAKGYLDKCETAKICIWIAVLAFFLIAGIFILVYTFDISHYHASDLKGDILGFAKSVLIWTVVSIVVGIAAVIVDEQLTKSSIRYAKMAIKEGDKETIAPVEYPKKRQTITATILFAVTVGVALLSYILAPIILKSAFKWAQTAIYIIVFAVLILFAEGILAYSIVKNRIPDKTKTICLWVARGVVGVTAITFIIVGIFNGGANDVLIKAINICTECIGLG